MFQKHLESELSREYRFVPLLRDTKTPVRAYAKDGGLTYREVVQRYPASQYQYALLLQSTDIVVVDIDTKTNPDAVKQIQEWIRLHGMEEEFRRALLVRTPSGGYHFYFRLPARYKATHARWINAFAQEGIPGVDVLSSGLLLIPGCTVNKRPYRQVGDSLNPRAQTLDKLPVLPESFFEFLTVRPITTSLPKEMRVTETDRQLKNRMLLDADKLEQFLRSKNARFRRQGNDFLLACLYHDDRNPSATIKITEDKLLYYCFACASENKGLYGEFVREYMTWAGKQVVEGKRVLNLRELQDLVKDRPKQPSLWNDSLLQLGTVTVLAGYQKDFKSTLARNIIARISRGLPLGEWKTQEGTALLLSFEENVDQFLHRLINLQPNAEKVFVVPRDEFENAFTVHANGLDPIEMLDRYCAMVQPQLLVIDTGWNFFNQVLEYRRYSMLGNMEVNKIFDEIKQVATRHGVAVLLIWHVRKNIELTGTDLEGTFQKMKDGVSGVRALASAADSVWFLRRKRRQEDETMPEVEFFAEGRHPRIYANWTMDEVAGALVDSVWLEQQYHVSRKEPNRFSVMELIEQAATTTPPEIDTPSVPNPENRNGGEPMIQTLDPNNIEIDLDVLEAPTPTEQRDAEPHVVSEPVAPVYAPFEEYYPPMAWYEFQEQPTDDSVWVLEKDETLGDVPCFTALRPGDRRKRGVYGHTLNCIRNGRGLLDPDGFSKVPALVFDIEATHVNPEVGRVCAIGTAVLVDGQPTYETRLLEEQTDAAEKALIEWFNQKLHRSGIDWVVGYNILGFDIPYLEKRAQVVGAKFDYFKRYYRCRKNANYRYGSSSVEVDLLLPVISPRHAVVDLYLLTLRYDANSGGNLPSYRMYDVYAQLTGEPAPQYDDKHLMAEWDPETIEDLVDTDVLITCKLMEYLLPVEYQLAQYLYLPFGEVLYAGQGTRVQQILVQDYLKRHRAIAHAEKQRWNFEGATARLERTGIFKNLVKVDVASLYPSIIIEHQIHPQNDYDKRLPELLKTMREERLRLKALKHDPKAQMQQQALKILINSAYGFMGASGFTFADWEAASEVTRIGREVLDTMYQTIVEFGGIPIELDTDGIIFEDRNGQAESILNALHERTVYQYDAESYEIGLFIGTKNYILRDTKGRIIYKGAAIRSRKEPPLFRDFIKNVIEALLDGQPIEPIFKAYQQRVMVADASELVAMQKVSERTKMTDGSTVRPGDTIYVWYSNRMDGEQRTQTPPTADELDRNRYIEKLVKILERFEMLREVQPVLQEYYTQGQKVLLEP